MLLLAVVKHGDSHQFCGFFPAAALGADFFFPDAALLREHLETVASWSASDAALAEAVRLRDEPRDDAMAEGGELGDAMGCVRLARVPGEEAVAVDG